MSKPKPYGRPTRQQQVGRHVMTCLREDAWRAVQACMAEHNLSRSGAIHHLVRLAAGLPPLN